MRMSGVCCVCGTAPHRVLSRACVCVWSRHGPRQDKQPLSIEPTRLQSSGVRVCVRVCARVCAHARVRLWSRQLGALHRRAHAPAGRVSFTPRAHCVRAEAPSSSSVSISGSSVWLCEACVRTRALRLRGYVSTHAHLYVYVCARACHQCRRVVCLSWGLCMLTGACI